MIAVIASVGGALDGELAAIPLAMGGMGLGVAGSLVVVGAFVRFGANRDGRLGRFVH